MAILSNKPHPATKLIAAELLSRWEFQSILGERPDVPKKPDPMSAIETSKHLEIMPEELLYLGDSGVDMVTARNAGMYGVGAAWGFRKVDELNENGAKAVIYNPLELLNLL
jgi:phosphoglycolate phosphatase